MTESSSSSTSPSLTPYHRARILLSIAAVISFTLFSAVAHLLHIPVDPGHSVSLLQQPAPILPLIVILIVLILAALIGSAIAGSIRQDAGLLTACVGLIAISARGGTITATLQSAASPAVYTSLAVELILLYAFICLAYFSLAPLRASHYLLPDHLHDGVDPHPDPRIESLGNKLLATAAQVLGTLLLLLLLAQSPDKAQSLAAVFLASLLAAAAAHSAFPVQPSIYFWIGPAIVGVIGYAYASVSPGPWLIGLPANPLASPLPLDYAAAGTPGALIGYWMSRGWQHARESTISPDSRPPASNAHIPMG